MKKIIFSLLFSILIFSMTAIVSKGFFEGTEMFSLSFYVVPPAYSGVPGGSSFLGPLSNSQRTYQILIRDSILTGLAGQELTAITWRLLASASSNWPAANVSFTNYDIYLSGSVAPENRSFTFANNVVGVQKRVRFGPLTIDANAFPFGGNPTSFGSDITFDSVYLYTGGHLLIEIRHTGFTGTSASVDAAGTSTPGYGYLYSACWAGSYTATSTTTQGNVVVTRINSQTPVGIVHQTEIVSEYTLNQNYPNPFNPSTTIKFSLPVAGKVRLIVYDIAGNELTALIDGKDFSAGAKSVNFNGDDLSSGVYFYSLFINGNKIDTKKMILIK